MTPAQQTSLQQQRMTKYAGHHVPSAESTVLSTYNLIPRQSNKCEGKVRYFNTNKSQSWSRVKPGPQKAIHVSHVGGWGTSIRVILHCSPRHISRELDEKQRSQDLNCCSDMGCWRCKQRPNCCATTPALSSHYCYDV